MVGIQFGHDRCCEGCILVCEYNNLDSAPCSKSTAILHNIAKDNPENSRDQAVWRCANHVPLSIQNVPESHQDREEEYMADRMARGQEEEVISQRQAR